MGRRSGRQSIVYGILGVLLFGALYLNGFQDGSQEQRPAKIVTFGDSVFGLEIGRAHV